MIQNIIGAPPSKVTSPQDVLIFIMVFISEIKNSTDTMFEPFEKLFGVKIILDEGELERIRGVR